MSARLLGAHAWNRNRTGSGRGRAGRFVHRRALNDIIERDNEQYDLDKAKPAPSAVAAAVQSHVRGEDRETIEGDFTKVEDTADAADDPFAEA